MLSDTYRELVVFEADLSISPWLIKNELPQFPKIPDYISYQWLKEQQCLERSDQLNRSHEMIKERYRDEGQCLVGIDIRNNTIISELWLTTKSAYIEWIFKRMHASNKGVFLYNIWLHPDYRGGTIYQYGIVLACQKAAQLGHLIVSAGVEERDFYPFARMHAILKTALLVPKHILIYQRLDSGIKVFRKKPPTKKSIEYSTKLKREYFL